jgi:hypothetical protein
MYIKINTVLAFQIVLTTLASACLVACGGGGGASGSTDSQLSGVAAYGSPLASASITVFDSAGKSVSTTAGIDGSYSANVTGFTAPLLVKASGTSGDAVKEYLALITTAPQAGKTGTANVTPLTHAIVTIASSDGTNPNEFTSTEILKTLDTNKVSIALSNLQASLSNVLLNAQLPATFDPMTAPFKADRNNGADILLDTIKVAVSDQGVSLTNARAPINEASDAVPSNTVTLKGTSATSTALPAPTVAAADMKGLDSFQVQLNKCLALAPNARASKDTNGVITLQSDCANISAFASNYKGYGYTVSQLWGSRFLEGIPENSTLDTPEFLLFLNSGTKALVRLATRSSSGGRVYYETAEKTNDTWQVTGNQRNYDASISVRLNKQTDLSTNGWTIPSTYTNSADKGTNVGKFDAYSSRLNFVFNQQGPNGSDVYAVRIKGPGLPSAGIVLARSSSCGTNDYLAFFRNNGTLPSLAVNAPALPSNSATSAWVLDVASFGNNYKGTEFYKQNRGITSTGLDSSSTSNNIAPAPVDMKDIPEFALYTWEVFSRTAPVDSFTSRIITRPLAATEGAKQPWATFSADSLEYLNPNITAKAGELTTATLSWTLPSASAPKVTSAYVYGSASAASGPIRMNMGQAIAKLGDTNLTVTASAESDGAGQTCSYSKVPGFTSTADYREIGTRQTTDRGLVLQQYSFHTGRAAN